MQTEAPLHPPAGLSPDAVAADAHDVTLFNRLSATTGLVKTGLHAQAIEEFGRIIATPGIPPESLACALAWRAHAFEKLGDYASARHDHATILASPGVPPSRIARATYGRARCSMKSAACRNALDDRARLREALADYTQVIDMGDVPAPASGAPTLQQLARFQRATLRMALHDPQGAQADCRHLRKCSGLPLKFRLKVWGLSMLARIGAPLFRPDLAQADRRRE